MDTKSASKSWSTDWTKCCLCQKGKKFRLSSPHTNPTKMVDDGYCLLARNIPQFHSANQLPIKLGPARLDDGDGMEKTLRKHRAKYHESCRLLFNNTKLRRAKKRLTPAAATDESGSSKVPRRAEDSKGTECFLCEEEGDGLREAMTMKFNKRLNNCKESQ